jgi:Protein of unknown function (DUF4254)
MNLSSFVKEIIEFQVGAIHRWKTSGVQKKAHDFLEYVEANHAFNYQLWHAEDRARRQDMGDAFVVEAKREIDFCNQQRNNYMEQMDIHLIKMLQPAHHDSCPVNSEAPGMMIDRLSILALKIYHMQEQTLRQDVDQTHIENCLAKLSQLKEQQAQLGHCLESLLQETIAKTRTFRVYYQHKMYNDPKLNPELYAKS